MKVLHPFTLKEPERKAKTWDLIESIKRAGFEVHDRETKEDIDYWELVASHWGKGDLIVLEDDKRPTTEQFKEMVLCQRSWCIFPYSFSMRRKTRMEDWTGKSFPFGLGFARFSLSAQLAVPVSDWLIPANGRKGWCLDQSIERPMMDKVGRPHIHGSFVAHDHVASTSRLILNYGGVAMTKLGLRKGDPLA